MLCVSCVLAACGRFGWWGYVGDDELVEFRWRVLCGACGALGAAVRQRRGAGEGSGKAAAGRRRGRDDGLPPSFFTRYPPQDVV